MLCFTCKISPIILIPILLAYEFFRCLRIVFQMYSRIFLIITWQPCARHRASVHEKKKNRMCRHTIFHSYCHYYGCYYSCLVMRFFFSATDARCWAPFLRKNRVLQSDDGNDKDDDAMVRTALPGAKERQTKNNNECAFAVVATIVGTSLGCRVLSHCWNASKPHASQAAGAGGDDGSGEIRM